MRINSPIAVAANFSTSVTDFTLDDVTVGNGTAANLIGDDSSSTFTFDVTPNAIADVTVDIGAGAVFDIDRDGNSPATQLSLGIPYDDDRDGKIQGSEVLDGVRDYFNGKLTGPQILNLVRLYFAALD